MDCKNVSQTRVRDFVLIRPYLSNFLDVAHRLETELNLAKGGHVACATGRSGLRGAGENLAGKHGGDDGFTDFSRAHSACVRFPRFNKITLLIQN